MYIQCLHIYISIFSLIFANSLLFWSFCTWLILVIYSLTNKEYMFTCSTAQATPPPSSPAQAIPPPSSTAQAIPPPSSTAQAIPPPSPTAQAIPPTAQAIQEGGGIA
jgi:hypothetical protein